MEPINPEPPPYVPPPSEAPTKRIENLRPKHLWKWLVAGVEDLQAHPGIAAFYGVSFWLMALVLGAVFRSSPQYAMSVASGCLLIGPFLAMGLYDVSRRREQGQVPQLGASLTCWDAHLPSMGMLVLVLLVLELLWGRASLVVFAVFFNTTMPSSTGVMLAIFNFENWEFLAAYATVGGAFAVIVYSIAVVSIPTILDRDADAITAAITSLEVIFNNPGAMLLWGASITTLVVMALLTPWSLGIMLIGPLLGHASWHAYRSAVHWD